MKKYFKYLLSFSMILVLLVSTLHITVYKMECLVSGRTQISLSNFEDCNKTTEGDCTVNEKCCCFHKMQLNFNYESKVESTSLNVFTHSALFLKIFSVQQSFFREVEYNFFTNLSPPSGYDLLKIVQVFRL